MASRKRERKKISSYLELHQGYIEDRPLSTHYTPKRVLSFNANTFGLPNMTQTMVSDIIYFNGERCLT